MLAEADTPFAGELRHNLYPYPEAQASFFAVRRDCYARSDIDPIVHHGAPAYFMQRSIMNTDSGSSRTLRWPQKIGLRYE